MAGHGHAQNKGWGSPVGLVCRWG